MLHTIIPPNPAPKKLTAYARPQNLLEQQLAFLAANNLRGFKKESGVENETSVSQIPRLRDYLDKYFPIAYIPTQDQRLEDAKLKEKIRKEDLKYAEARKYVVRRHIVGMWKTVSCRTTTAHSRVPRAFLEDYVKELSTLRLSYNR